MILPMAESRPLTTSHVNVNEQAHVATGFVPLYLTNAAEAAASRIQSLHLLYRYVRLCSVEITEELGEATRPDESRRRRFSPPSTVIVGATPKP